MTAPAPEVASALLTPAPLPPTRARPAASFVRSALTFVAKLVDGLGLSPLIANNPLPPLQQPTLVGLLGLVRRQFEVTLFNQSPTAKPVQISQSLGVVNGTLGVVDAERDPLTYNVIQGPTKGSVIVNGDGTYVYKPSAALAVSGGTDKFVVSVSDNTSLHLHLFNGTGVISVPVTVTVAANSSAPVAVGDAPSAVVLSPDGLKAYVLNAGDNTLSVIDTATNKVSGTIGVGNIPVAVAVSPVLHRAYTADLGGNTVSVIDTDTNAVVATVSVGESPAGIAVSPDGAKVYVANAGSNTVSVIATGTNTVAATVAVGGTPLDVAVSPDGKHVYVANNSDGTVSVINTADNSLAATIAGIAGAPQGVVVSPDSSRVYVGSTVDSTVTVIDAATNTVATYARAGSLPGALGISPTGDRVYVSNAGSNTVSVIETATNTTVGSIAVGVNPGGLAISKDGTKVYVTNAADGTVSVLAVDPTLTLSPSGQAPLGSTAGFKVYNLTDVPITLSGYRSTSRPDNGGPGIGTVIPPGGYIDFEIVQYAFKTNTVQPTFTSANGTYTVTLTKELLGGPAINYCTSTGSVSCSPQQNTQQQLTSNVLLLNAAGSTTIIPAGQGQAQSQYLSNLCYSGSPATCTFTPTSQEAALTDGMIIGNIVKNSTQNPLTTSIATSEMVGSSDSVTISAKASLVNIKKILNLELMATYGHTWTRSTTFTKTVGPFTIQPNYQGYVVAQQPLDRDYGNFTLTAGGTTIILQNVYFDSPNPDGTGTYDARTEPIPSSPM